LEGVLWLTPSSQGKRIGFDGTNRTVVDAPFTDTRELVAGYWLWDVKDMDETVAWVKRRLKLPKLVHDGDNLSPLWDTSRPAPSTSVRV
jgi:hypothetical protein